MDKLKFINTAIKTLPLDPIKENYVRTVPACFSISYPTPITNPRLVHYSAEALALLDLDQHEITKPLFSHYFCGNKILPGSQPVAHCYCGHQFGHFSGQLGDGRAHLLGEIINNRGERYELQLKGSGKTPYSRKGDGRAVLRSSIREFLCSEAMYHLEIPTTRAVTIITSDTYVDRDIKYNGNITRERATVLSRVAPTFIRFGSFQISDRGGPSYGNKEIIRKLLDYVILHQYPNIYNSNPSFENRVIAFVEELTKRTANLVALWQCCGFTHGVLNTDNMSIIGYTMDYGPFGFMDNYDPDFISNTSDSDTGRYKYKNQAAVCKWNLEKLFQSISYSVPTIQSKLNKILENFCVWYKNLYMDKMRKKLGLFYKFPEDELLVQQLLDTMHISSGDYTNIFRSLSQFQIFNNIEKQPVLEYILSQTQIKSPDQIISNRNKWISWFNLYKKRIEKESQLIQNPCNPNERIQMMNSNNPRYILRNHLAQRAIEKAENGDFTEVKRLLDVLRDPYDVSGKYHGSDYDKIPQKSAKIVLSCSS